MRTRNGVAVFAIMAAVVGAISITASRALATPVPRDGAIVIDDFNCGLYNAFHVVVHGTVAHAVITPSGNRIFKCFATGLANPTGRAIRFEGFSCGVGGGVLTTDSHETISAEGDASLTCILH